MIVGTGCRNFAASDMSTSKRTLAALLKPDSFGFTRRNPALGPKDRFREGARTSQMSLSAQTKPPWMPRRRGPLPSSAAVMSDADRLRPPVTAPAALLHAETPASVCSPSVGCVRFEAALQAAGNRPIWSRLYISKNSPVSPGQLWPPAHDRRDGRDRPEL